MAQPMGMGFWADRGALPVSVCASFTLRFRWEPAPKAQGFKAAFLASTVTAQMTNSYSLGFEVRGGGGAGQIRAVSSVEEGWRALSVTI